ncbi:hypothetical protein ACFSVK_06185 [Azorhizophilus paspali]|uniref:hypothetical protein n=1 Tax=Azorhizophilus paspali TaxID=69963 RepID=UPI003629081F
MHRQQVTLINGDAADHGRACDLILTDPPYDMSGAELARILGRFEARHLVLITTMRQLLEFMPRTDWRLNFDFVLDGVLPKNPGATSSRTTCTRPGCILPGPA